MKNKSNNPYYIIQTGPVPRLDQTSKYPFASMEVGNFFEVPYEEDHAVRVRASQYGKRHGQRYTVRRTTDQDGKPTRVRVHRVE